MFEYFKERDVLTLTMRKVVGLLRGVDVIDLNHGKENLLRQTVVIAVGTKPVNNLIKDLRRSGTLCIGDCNQPRSS
jgi:hypothetical protein